MKKVVAFVLGVIVSVLCVACGATSQTGAGVNQGYKHEIEAAANKLCETYTNYVIATTSEFAGQQSEYIEVIKGNDIYTEVSVSDDAVGTIPYGSSDTISYALVDWTHDNIYYSMNTTDDGQDVVYKFPAVYATKYNYDREALCVRRMLETATSIESIDDLTLDLSTGTETCKAYRMNVPGKTVMEVLSATEYGVYMSIKENEKSGSNISKLCDFYLQNTERARTYSDAEVVVAIDENGILKFSSIEVGGLGTYMYITKAVADIRNPNVREMPDFSSAVPVESTMTEMADFVAQYPDYDSAVKALNEKYAVND